jgi:hypothetical protein
LTGLVFSREKGWIVASTCSTTWYGAALKNMYSRSFLVAVGNCYGLLEK